MLSKSFLFYNGDMANNISETYTDEIYLSKSQLQNVLQTSLIDGYWNEVMSYRKKHARRLNMRSLRNDIAMGVILTPAILAKIDGLEAQISRITNTLKKLDPGQERDQVEKALLYRNLFALSKLYGTPMNEVAIKALLGGRYRESNESHRLIIDFYRTLTYFLNHRPLPADDNFLGEAYARLLNVEELTSFYREKDFDGVAKKAALTNGDFPYAPYEKIQPFMDDLFAALQGDLPPFVKAALALYYVDSLAPFDQRNHELAALLSMDTLANLPFGNEAFYLPFVCLLEKNERREEARISSSRTGDFTYFLLYCVDLFKAELTSLQQEIEAIRTELYRKEANASLTKEEVMASRYGQEKEEFSQMSIFGEAEVQEAKKKAVITSRPIPEPRVVAPKPIPKQEPIEPAEEGEISLSMNRRALSEKEAKEYTQYLLESNPALNKKQASFLATHCTMGHYYTIQQFKKFAHCAYETARTSMDKLAAERYYEKRQIKNKYVYTPIAMNGDPERRDS